MNGVFGHISALRGYTGLGTTWAIDMKPNKESSKGSIKVYMTKLLPFLAGADE